MPGSGCQGHSQPGDGKYKRLPHSLSPGEHPSRGEMCVPSQVSIGTNQQGWGVSGHLKDTWGGGAV